MLVCRGFPQWRDSHRGGQFETARLEIVRALLAARANVGLSNTEGHTALHVLLSSAFPTGDEGPHEELSALLEAKSDAIKPLSDGQVKHNVVAVGCGCVAYELWLPLPLRL